MNTALIVIDVQRFFINRNTLEIPPKIADFIKQTSFDLLLFTKFVNIVDSPWFKAGWKRMMTSSETDIVDELTNFSNSSNTFEKTAFSIFAVEEIREILQKNSIQKLFLCGLDTHACVYASALEAFSRGYKVHVIQDLCGASHGRQYHEQALNFITVNLGKNVLVQSTDILTT